MSEPLRRPPALDPGSARVAVVLPVRNEARFLKSALCSVLDQDFALDRMEVIVVDGRSDDTTREVVASIQPEYGLPPVRLVDNPRLSIPAAMNIGIKETSADVVVRVDGHCRLEPNYVSTCVRLLAQRGAANVGGLMRPSGEGPVGEAMAVALCSRFGIGDSKFHFSEQEEWVETAYLGAFRRVVLEEVGGYDERLLSNEDFELNHRITTAGYGVLLSPEVRSRYTPRDSLGGIARQFFRYGLWKSRVMRKHPDSIRPRHLAAPVLVISLVWGVSSLLRGRRRGLLPVLLYGASLAVACAVVAPRKRVIVPLLGVFPAMHLSWGAGVVIGLLRRPTGS